VSDTQKTVYLYEDSAVVNKEGPHLRVRVHDELIFTEPLSNIECLIIFNLVQITTQCVRSLLSQGADILYTTKNRKIFGCAYARYSRRPALRMAQYAIAAQPDDSLLIAKKLIAAKIAGQRKTISAFRNIDASAAARALKDAENYVNDAADSTQLLGYEGASAARYFKALSQCLKNMIFIRRDAHPAHDPFNALLNLTYMLTLHKIDSILFGKGFDTSLGFPHTDADDRMALSLDILEPFRGLLDRFVVKMVNLGEIKDNDFESGGQGCVLTKKGFTRYIARYSDEIEITPAAEVIAERLKECLMTREGALFEIKDMSRVL